MRQFVDVMRGLVVVGVVAAQAAAAEWGTLSGQFIYDGQAAAPAKLVVDKDLECCGKYLDEIVDETITVGPEGGLANVYVYLRSPKGKKVASHPDLEAAAASTPVVLDNMHCRFQQHAIAVWGGKQTLVAKNGDPIGHAVAVALTKNAPVNSLLPAGQSLELKFQEGEPLPAQITCGPHPWEKAWVKVHDSPYIAVTDRSGKFTIPNLPVGDWEFQVWHEKSGYLAAKPEWSKGRVKLAIKAGDNDFGVIKVSPDLLTK
jgi:hypothetical protein